MTCLKVRICSVLSDRDKDTQRDIQILEEPHLFFFFITPSIPLSILLTDLTKIRYHLYLQGHVWMSIFFLRSEKSSQYSSLLCISAAQSKYI